MIKNMNTATIRKPSATSIATPRPHALRHVVIAVTESVGGIGAHSHCCGRSERCVRFGVVTIPGSLFADARVVLAQSSNGRGPVKSPNHA
jgi:hypothetical protein